MTGFVRWLLGGRYRLVLLAAVLAPFPIVACLSTALMTLETLYRGPKQGLVSAVAAAGGVLLFSWAWGGNPGDVVQVGGAALLAGTGLGALLRWAGSLALAFQGLVLACAAGALLSAVLWPEPGALVASMVAQLAELVRSTGAAEQQVSALVEGWELFFVGLMTAGILLQLVSALLLGSWWASLMREEAQFGPEFRELRLGRFLGIPATLLMAASLVLDGPPIRNLFPLVLCAFWFQGLAVIHAWGWAKRWRTAFMALIYVLLLPPFTAATILVLASVGLVDNWFELRAPLRAKS